jgi:hypothetical protein
MRNHILQEIEVEMCRQKDLWGEQNHPSVIPDDSNTLASEAPATWFYGMPDEVHAKRRSDTAARSGALTYAHIAVEELSEAIDASDDTARREELVQLGAVVASWIEAIDRNNYCHTCNGTGIYPHAVGGVGITRYCPECKSGIVAALERRYP